MIKLGNTSKTILLILVIILCVLRSYSATRTATSSGNWSNTATWGGNPVPTASDDVTINNGINVTVNAAAYCNTLTTANSGTLTISGTNTLTVTGLINMFRPSANNTSFTIAVGTGSLVAGALTMNATTTTRNNIITISTGTVTINGTVTTGTTGCQFVFTGNGLLKFGGSFSGGPASLTAANGTIEYTGTAPVIQAFTGNYYNLVYSGNGTTANPSGNLNIQGNLLNTGGGTLNFYARNVSLSGTTVSNTIDGFTTTGTVTMSKTAGTATFTGNVNASVLTINGSGGTLNLGAGLTHTFTGNWTRTNGTLDGGSSLLKIAGSVSGTGGRRQFCSQYRNY